MKVSLLVPNISLPTIGAALRIARMIDDVHDVEIVGPDMGHGVCSMYRGAHAFKAVFTPRIYRLPDYIWERRRVGEALTGDVIISFKAFANSLPIALSEKKRRGVPVVIYLDEWDGAIVGSWPRRRRIRAWLRDFYHPGDDIYCPLIERMISRADAVVSTTSFLRNRFGGRVIHLGVDTERFKPQPRAEVDTLKKSLGYEEFKLIGFGGVVRPHKGMEIILEALARMDDPRIRLLVIGPLMPYLRELMTHPRWGRYILCQGSDPDDKNSTVNAEVHDRMPLYLALADILAVPLSASLLAQSQMPCKVFEAMAMGKPVIASAVSDLPEIIGDAGWIVSPDEPANVETVLREILSSAEEAGRRARKARERAVELYSREVAADAWLKLLDEVIG